MEFSKIHHLAVICHDRQAALAFYVAKLGFRIIAQHQRFKQADWKIDLRQRNLALELFIKPDAPKRPSYPEACGIWLLQSTIFKLQLTF
jgi:glyoxylase I family protein